MIEVENPSITPIPDVTSHVFISYSRSNSDAMQSVARALIEANIPVWTDERLVAGTSSWKNSIEVALQGAFCVVVLMSPTAKSSEWVERELDYAYVLQRPIYPVLVKGSQRDAVPFELINMQYIDARTDFNQGVNQLISLLKPYMITRSVNLEIPVNSNTELPSLKQSPRIFVGEPMSDISNTHPSIMDMLLYSLGIKGEDSEITAQYTAHIRSIVYWYFLKPRKFRLFSAMTQDSTARLIHASVLMVAYLWIIGLALFFQLLPTINSTFPMVAFFALFICFYGIVLFIPMTTPYKTRRAFFGSVLYALLLLGLISLLLWIAFALITAMLFVLRKA